REAARTASMAVNESTRATLQRRWLRRRSREGRGKANDALDSKVATANTENNMVCPNSGARIDDPGDDLLPSETHNSGSLLLT
ncbi:hypothetical protein ACLOJK_039323, partial [Asimina triloba]